MESDDFHRNLHELLKGVKTELVAFIEDDDWYHPRYLLDMVQRLEYSKRMLIGYDPTLYYHIALRGYQVLPHKNRASLYTTIGTTPSITLAYGEAYEKANGRPFSVDFALWARLAEVAVTTVGHYAVGIKHGFTKTEGKGHYLPKEYWNPDSEFAYLRQLIGGDVERYQDIIAKYGGQPGVLPELQGAPV
jgi:hypothetical protein